MANANSYVKVQTIAQIAQTIILVVGVIIALCELTSLGKQLQGNSLQQIQANDREIKALLFNNPYILSLTTSAASEEQLKSNIYLALVINHAKHIFLQHQLGYIPKEYWDAVDRDMDQSVEVKRFQAVWEKVEAYQPDSYRKYVNSKIAKHLPPKIKQDQPKE